LLLVVNICLLFRLTKHPRKQQADKSKAGIGKNNEYQLRLTMAEQEDGVTEYLYKVLVGTFFRFASL
jgi:hypothetical protein